MAKIVYYNRQSDGDKVVYIPKCPGCGGRHYVPVENEKIPHRWGFNGNINDPTLIPSVNEYSLDAKGINFGTSDPLILPFRCHFILTNGVMAFCDDCTHDSKNMSLTLPDIDLEYYGTIYPLITK